MRFGKQLAWVVISLLGAAAAADIENGRKIISKSGGGNCIACHVIAGGGESPGNMGPPLVAVKQRFPDRDDLRARVWDATVFNPISSMPPFGKHRILSEEQIDDVVDFLYTL